MASPEDERQQQQLTWYALCLSLLVEPDAESANTDISSLASRQSLAFSSSDAGEANEVSLSSCTQITRLWLIFLLLVGSRFLKERDQDLNPSGHPFAFCQTRISVHQILIGEQSELLILLSGCPSRQRQPEGNEPRLQNSQIKWHFFTSDLFFREFRSRVTSRRRNALFLLSFRHPFLLCRFVWLVSEKDSGMLFVPLPGTHARKRSA